jgi:hypothetical protein
MINDSLFNNPMVNNALKAMTPEQLAGYKKIGEQLYGSINYVDSKIINNMSTPMEEAVAYVEEGIKSGLLPQDLDENEVILLTKTYGDEWYLRYGFKKENVPEPGLSLKVKDDIEKAIKFKIKEAEKENSKKHK